MKQTVFGADAAKYKTETNKRISLSALVAVAVIVLNVIFTALRTDENHILMLILNIFVDIAGVWFLIYFITVKISPRCRLSKLYGKKKSKHEGVIDEISDDSITQDGFDCLKLKIGERVFFLISDGAIKLEAGQKIMFLTVGNVIVEAKVLK